MQKISPDETAPNVTGRSQRLTNGGWIFRLDKCPYCAERHTHGLGDDASILMKGTLTYGHRVAHCAPDIKARNPATNAGYVLVADVI